MEQLNLIKQSVWSIVATVDERSSRSIGYYKNSSIAFNNAKGAGWYGSDGTVELVDVYEDDKGNIYEVKPKGRCVDVAEKAEEEMINVIKSKLSDNELEFLGI